MARPLRIQFAGAFYHVFARGNNKQPIFLVDVDRLKFLSGLMQVSERLDWWIWSYCLMDNHYHLLLETREPTLSRGMRDLNGAYSQYFNRRHQRVGHVFQGRFQALLVDNDAYLKEIARYIVLNPVRAGLCTTAGQWRWSSYQNIVGASSSLARLAAEPLIRQFASTTQEGLLRYVEFVAAGIADDMPTGSSTTRSCIGDESFDAIIASRFGRPSPEVPRPDRPRFTLEHYANTSAALTDAIRAAYFSGAYSQIAIARHFGLHYSTVSKIVNSSCQNQESRPDPLTIQDLTPTDG